MIINNIIYSILLTYCVHYLSTKTYNQICIPDNIIGFLYGFISTGSPTCNTILYLMNITEKNYSSIIVVGLTNLILDYIR